MDILEAIEQRHSVRQYSDREIEGDVAAKLEAEIAECNRLGGLHMQLKLNEPKAMDCLLARGSFKNAVNYVALVAPKDGFDEAVGWYGERIALYAKTLGLGSCWVAGSYKKIPEALDIADGEKIYMIITIGYGLNDGKQHKSKAAEAVSNISPDSPEWFRRGVEAALLAPTAINQQKFKFELTPDGVKAKAGLGPFSKTDLGIVKYHFAVAAGEENFKFI